MLARDKCSSLFGPFVVLQVRPGAYPGEGGHLELTCKGLPGTNTPSYLEIQKLRRKNF